MSDRAKLTGYPDHETVRMAIAVANAARHGVTAEILGILRDRLATADATVAALTAENERLRSLFDAEDAKALDEYAEDEARSVGSHLHHLAARIRAALPSSREDDRWPD